MKQSDLIRNQVLAVFFFFCFHGHLRSDLLLFLFAWWAVETEKYRFELSKVRAELEPWEKELIVHKGKLEVAHTESNLLTQKVRLYIAIHLLIRLMKLWQLLDLSPLKSDCNNFLLFSPN